VSRIWLPRRHAAEALGLDRRTFIAAGVAAGTTGLLTLAGCNSEGPKRARGLLRAAERWNERVERALFRHDAMNTAPAGVKAAGDRFPSYFISAELPVWNAAARGVWRLEVGGTVKRSLSLTLDELTALPRAELRLEHFCVEGWSAVATRTGVRLADLARLVELDPSVRYVDFQSFDSNYHESWDIESALHPQTLIVYGQDGRLLDPAYGAPARVYSPVKLGYKNTKYLTRVLFLPQRNGGYWSDQGYEWYAGV
jgi:DMSO/TMAO reductase YedYZ molybdopterin-dependent catalytic subunit